MTKFVGSSVMAVVVATSCSLAVSSVALSILVPVPAFANDQPRTDIDKLETKFFRHMYQKDSNNARLDRLEKMVFGETKSGSEQERISGLLKLVSEDDLKQMSGSGSSKESQSASSGGGSSNRTADDSSAEETRTSRKPGRASSTPSSASSDSDSSTGDYPAVSAIEKKLFGHDFHDENVDARLARLEKKVFKQVSSSNDLSERMDALKSATGIDIARRPPAGADWADEDEGDMEFPAPSEPISRHVPGVNPRSGDDAGTSFSGRNVAQDLNRAFGRTPVTSYDSGSYGMSGSGSYGASGSGSYGMSGAGSYGMSGTSRSGIASSSGSYGFGRGTPPITGSRRSSGFSGSSGLGSAPGYAASGYGSYAGAGSGNKLAYAPPRTAPQASSDDSDSGDGLPPVAPQRAAGGLTGQVEALEQQVFGKTFQRDGLTQRLDRLENVVYPSDKNLRTKTPGERIAKLAQVIPIGGASNAISQNRSQDAYQNQAQDPYNQNQPQNGGQDPNATASSSFDPGQAVAQAPQRRGGLSRILNSLGNLFTGGMPVGGYAMPQSTLITDPTTGYLINQTTGDMIDPHTGVVVGRRAVTGYSTPIPGAYGINSFSNGFSPYYSPYGGSMYGSNSIYGIGRSGFGFGGMGTGIRFGGGMWP